MASVVSTPPIHRTPWMTVRKYANIFRASLVERMTYRGDFLLGTILRFLPVMTTILLWEAVYAGRARDLDLAVEDVTIADFSLRQMVAYLLLIHISRMFSSMPGLAGGISRDIKDGSLKKYLVQPLDMIGYLISYRAAHKTAYIMTSSLPYAGLFFICAGYFDGFPDPLTMVAYVLSLLMAFVIGFFFEACMGMAGFWLLEVTSLLWIVTTLNYFISGQMMPLDLLPDFWRDVLQVLPFQYLAYFPAVVFLGKMEGMELVRGLLIQFAWAVAFVFLTRWMYSRGLRRYSAYGG